jgi:hypothetical protein
MKRKYFSEEDLERFNRDGFIVVHGLLSPEEMVRVSAWAEEVEHWPEVPGRHMVYHETSILDPNERILQRIENVYPYHEGFRVLFDDDRIKDRIAELLGEPAVLFKEKINFKYPGSEGFKHHQDQAAGWWEYGSLFISVLISIDEATVENGCLEIAPGDERHRHLEREWKPYTEEEIKKMPFSPVPTKRGDVIFFDSFVPHGSYPNLSDKRRRILYVTYNRLSEGDHRVQYCADKRKSYPPDCEREPGKTYVFRV